jgi:pantoate--beta-alanine ligase
MGALHGGHLDLVNKSRLSCDVTIVSIFVNPTQFNNSEDFLNYPKTLELDLEKLKESGVDYVFLPTVEVMYASPPKLKFDFGDLELVLEGKFRPGHFNGVGVVVAKLFHLIKPHIAFFGQKDLQQVAVIKRLVKDLSFDLHLDIVPTRRESDGLAMSSRNLRLNPAQRQLALILVQSMEKAKSELLAGKTWIEIKHQIELEFENEPSAKLDYFELIHPDTFETFNSFDATQSSSICVAAFIGDIRLIDNLPIIS